MHITTHVTSHARFVRSFLSGSALAMALALSACGSPLPSESVGHTGQAATAVDPAFTSCLSDFDCVAIPQAGCCHNGWLVAVSVGSVDDYDAANACTSQQPNICPQYVVNDTRVPSCDATSGACVLVQPAAATPGDDAGAGDDAAAGDDAGGACATSN